MNYRFKPDEGFRRQGEPYEKFDAELAEVATEDFDSFEEYLLACMSVSMDILFADLDSEDDSN